MGKTVLLPKQARQKIMDMIPKWLQMLAAVILGLGSLLVGSGFLAKSSDLSSQDIRNQQMFAQASDVQTLKQDVNKRIDSVQDEINRRFDRLEDLILEHRGKKS